MGSVPIFHTHVVTPIFFQVFKKSSFFRIFRNVCGLIIGDSWSSSPRLWHLFVDSTCELSKLSLSNGDLGFKFFALTRAHRTNGDKTVKGICKGLADMRTDIWKTFVPWMPQLRTSSFKAFQMTLDTFVSADKAGFLLQGDILGA